jgi:hypothetical protein
MEERAKHSHRKKALEQLAGYLCRQRHELAPVPAVSGD